MTLSLAILGCGMMGRRHVLGLGRLRDVGRLPFDLVAAVDPVAASGEALADLAAERLGRRPAVAPSFGALAASLCPDAIIVTTAPNLHLAVTLEALAAGCHVMVEKPIALTVRQGLTMVAAAATAGRHLAVAENYRRDPINRLAKAVIDAGAVGRPYLMIQSSSGSGESVIITPWRHRKQSGGIAVDMGVHYADLFEYFLGPIESVVGMNAVVDRERRDVAGTNHPADAEDLTVGAARFASGALANLLMNLAGRGEGHFSRVVHGTGGSLTIPQDRTGNPLALAVREGGSDRAVAPSDQLALVPGFALDATTAALFGGERLTAYDLAYADIDAGLLAIEQDDFAAAILGGHPPEVDGAAGLRSLAIAYGFLEADRLGRIMPVEALLAGGAAPYQDEFDPA